MAAPVASRLSGWEMTGGGEPLRKVERELRALAPGEVLVRVAGCGVCHTDLGFLDGSVRTRAALPLVLGHEISGWVDDAGPEFRSLVGRAVVVPAVTPCGGCGDCRAGRSMICTKQVMPGNDCDGGFASHTIVPGRGLCPVPGNVDHADAALGSVPGLTLRHLSVVADAVSTAYQAVARSGVRPGELAIVVGLGGVGGYAAQIAADAGALVVGLDVDEKRRSASAASKVALALDPKALSPKELRAQVKEFARSKGASETGWTILECSGSAGGQTTAWGLLGPGATVMVVGFTLDQIQVRLSNLMAFDARALGNWGCAPELYPAILDKVLAGKIDVVSTSEIRPLSQIEAVLDDVRHHRASRRIVLAPEN